MLVLSRNKDEQIRIGPDIVITIVEGSGRIRVGIDAPKSIAIERAELTNSQPKEGPEEPKSEAVLEPVLPPRF